MRALLVALALRADVAEAAEPACRQSLAKSCSGDLPADAAARGVLAPVNLRGDAPEAPRPHCMAVHVAEVDRHISRTILRQGSYGHAHIFAAIFNATPGSLYLDVGANIGFHTLQAAAAGMRTVSWEPHPVNQALLRWSLERNCFRHVHLVPSPAGAPDQLGAIMTARSRPRARRRLRQLGALLELNRRLVVERSDRCVRLRTRPSLRPCPAATR